MLFLAVGCLVMTTVDSVPRDLVVNALILGTLSVVTGMVFILDTCLSHRGDYKKSQLPKNTRYGDIARTRTVAATAPVDVVDSMVHAKSHANGHSNGHVNGHSNGHANVHSNGYTNGHANGHTNGILKREAVDKKQSGLLQTAVETKNEGVQTTMTRGEDSGIQHGRKYSENRGFSRHADWYDVDMDLLKMKKLEINVPEESPDYRRRSRTVKI